MRLLLLLPVDHGGCGAASVGVRAAASGGVGGVAVVVVAAEIVRGERGEATLLRKGSLFSGIPVLFSPKATAQLVNCVGFKF